MKFHEDRCKGEAFMRLKPFYLTARLQTDRFFLMFHAAENTGSVNNISEMHCSIHYFRISQKYRNIHELTLHLLV